MDVIPDWFWAAVVFIYGAVVGSFLNVCIWRLPRDESVVHPPSHCPHCGKALAPADLVPLASQVLLRGRCRYCGIGISWRYFGVELLTGLCFVVLFYRFGLTVEMVANALFVATLIVVLFVDLDHYVIPDVTVYIGIALGILKDVALILQGQRRLWHEVPGTTLWVPIPLSIIGLFLGAGALWLIAVVASAAFGREAMGMGDVFLLAAMGANLTPGQLALAFFIAVAVGSIVGVILMAMKLRGRRDEVPFGPMLVVGTFVALVFGDQIIGAYLKVFTLQGGA
jgi:leader peptidase (prepilin peptidase) / N-methyltransferase